MARINLFAVTVELNFNKHARGIKFYWRTRGGKRQVRPQATQNQIPKITGNKPGRKPLWNWLIARRRPEPQIVDRPKQEPVLDLLSLDSHSAEVSGLEKLEAKLKGFLTNPSPNYSEVAEDLHRLHNLFPDSEEHIDRYFTRQSKGEYSFRAGFSKALILLEQGKEGQCRKMFRQLQAEMDKDMFTGTDPEKVAMLDFLDQKLRQFRAERSQKNSVAPEPEATPEIPFPEPLDLSGTPDELRGRAKLLVDQEDFYGAEKVLNHLLSLPEDQDNDRRSTHVLNSLRMGKQAQAGKFLGGVSVDALRQHRELLLDYQKRGYWFDVQVEGLKKLEEVISKHKDFG